MRFFIVFNRFVQIFLLLSLNTPVFVRQNAVPVFLPDMNMKEAELRMRSSIAQCRQTTAPRRSCRL